MKKLGPLLLLLAAFELSAQEQTFEREYTYRASELDSRLTCRAIATNQLRSMLLNEIGVYVESESLLKTSDVSGQFSQDFTENIATISAGITKLVIIQETWDGEVFWLKAAITIDKAKFEESLKQLIIDRHRVKELEDLNQELTKTNELLLKITKELKDENKATNKTSLIEKYKNEIGKLNFIDFFYSGLSKSDNGDYDGAVTDLTKAIELNPQYSDAFVSRGSAKYQRKDTVGAIQDFTRAIELHPSDAQLYFHRAGAKVRYDSRGAISDYNKAIELEPENVFFYLSRGLMKYLLGLYKEAISDFTSVIEINFKYPNATYPAQPLHILYNSHCLSDAYGMRGRAKAALADDMGAIADFNKAIELAPRDASLYNERGSAKTYQNDFGSAIDDFTSAIQFSPELAESYYNRGIAKTALHDYKGAIVDYDKSIDLNPRLSDAYLNRGKVKMATEDYIGAISDFTKVLDLNPKNMTAFYLRGLNKYQLGDRKGACLDWSTAGELGYSEAYNAMKQFCEH